MVIKGDVILGLATIIATSYSRAIYSGTMGIIMSL